MIHGYEGHYGVCVIGEPSEVLFEHPVPVREGMRSRITTWMVLLIPLLVVLLYRWPLDGACMLVWVILTICITLVTLVGLEKGPVISVQKDRFRVEDVELHPLELDVIETYFDEGHIGNRIESRPHFVFIFYWIDMEGKRNDHELLWRISKGEHDTVVEGLKSALPGVRIHRLPDKGVRLRK
jgi:hypothetical protein